MVALSAPKRKILHIRVEVKVEDFLIHVSEWRREGDTGSGRQHYNFGFRRRYGKSVG
jgi:hypothetical protein